MRSWTRQCNPLFAGDRPPIPEQDVNFAAPVRWRAQATLRSARGALGGSGFACALPCTARRLPGFGQWGIKAVAPAGNACRLYRRPASPVGGARRPARSAPGPAPHPPGRCSPGQQATRLRLPPGGCGRDPESACTTRTVRFRACRLPRLATARDVREPVLVGQLATGRLGRVEQAGGGPFGVIHERVAVALEAEDHLVAGALGIVRRVGLMPGQQGGEQAHVGR